MSELGTASTVMAEPSRPPWSRLTGADEQFRRMFVESYPSVARTVWLLVGDREVAQEITQEAFIQLLLHWRKVSRFEQPGLWVRRVAIRRAQRERHRIWQRIGVEQSAAPMPVSTGPDEPDDAVRAAVQALPPKQRAVVVLFYFEDRPMDEIADLLGSSVSSCWSQLHTARRKLALVLSEEVDDDVR
jgi:RNA polymerase sigma factor (sigma-70 family)